MATARTPKRPFSTAVLRVSEITPALALPYAARSRGAPSAAFDAVLTITPEPCSIMCRSAARVP